MPDIKQVDQSGVMKTFTSTGKGTYAEVTATSGLVSQAIPDNEIPAQLAAQWGDFAGIDWAGGDFVAAVSGLNGQAIIALSGSPLTIGESFATNTNEGVPQPAALEFAGSFVRTGISFATASLFANGPNGPDSILDRINIVSCYQSSSVQGAAYNATAGTVMHLQLASALPAAGSGRSVFIGDWINIAGLVDNRLNYPSACLNYISPDRTVIAVGFSDEVALPSLAVPVITPTLGTAQVHFYSNMSGARNGFGLRFTGTTATSAAIVSIFAGDDNQVSGALLGDQRVTILSTAPTYVAGANWGQYEIRATNRFMLEAGLGAAVVMDKPEQAFNQWTVRDVPRTSVKPASESLLFPRFRLFKPVNMSRPICKIVTAVKTGTTTATVTTDVPHGLVTNNWVTLKGARDVTNFASLTVPVQVTVTGANSFTVVWGAAVTATTYGGSVIITNGGRDQPGIIGQTVQSVVSRVANGGNWLDVIGNTTWAGASPGDYVDLHGVRADLTGANLGLDGAWEIANIANTTLTLRPVTDIRGVRVSPALGTLVSTNCGGTVILRPTLRNHDLSVRSWSELNIMIDGAGTTRSDKALPMVAVGGTFTATQGAVASIGTGGSGAWPVRSAAVRTIDVASAAITTTQTSAAIDVSGTTGAQQFTTDVTVVSGTLPRMYPRIQESLDGGVNWFTTYDLAPIDNSTDKSQMSPPMPIIGTHVRYVRKVTGTSPSFTNSVIRTNRPGEHILNRRQLVDSVVSLTATTASTDLLYVDGCYSGQLVLTLGAATTPPTVKVQLCDGNPATATNWYDVPSATVAGTANTTVASAVFALSSGKFARLVPTVAGTGITADSYTLLFKAWI